MTGLQGKRWCFFIWDENNEEHLAKHHIKDWEAEEVFFNPIYGSNYYRMGYMKQTSLKAAKNYKYKANDWDDSESVEVIPEKKTSGISTSIRLPKEMVTKLRRIARKKGDIGYQTLLKIWIAERLEKEIA